MSYGTGQQRPVAVDVSVKPGGSECGRAGSGGRYHSADPVPAAGCNAPPEAVETRRAGKMVYYRIEDNRIMTLLNTLYDLYCPQAGTGKGSHNNE